MAKTTTHERASTSAKTGMTPADVPNVAASMLQQFERAGFVAHVGNSKTRPGELVIYVAGLAVCDARHIYALPGPCAMCATSGTGAEVPA